MYRDLETGDIYSTRINGTCVEIIGTNPHFDTNTTKQRHVVKPLESKSKTVKKDYDIGSILACVAIAPFAILMLIGFFIN